MRDIMPLVPTRGSLMLMALVLICSAAVVSDIGECTTKNARTVMRVPAEFNSPLTCFRDAQAYLAEASFGQELDGRDLIRIVCVRRDEASAAR